MQRVSQKERKGKQAGYQASLGRCFGPQRHKSLCRERRLLPFACVPGTGWLIAARVLRTLPFPLPAPASSSLDAASSSSSSSSSLSRAMNDLWLVVGWLADAARLARVERRVGCLTVSSCESESMRDARLPEAKADGVEAVG